VSLDGLFAGGHARGEAERLSARRASGARVAHRKLTDRAAQEVEAHLALMLVQGVGDARLAWLELQSYLCQPGAQRALGRFHTLRVRVEDDQIIRIADEPGAPSFGWHGSRGHLFHAVESDVTQQRADYPSYNSAKRALELTVRSFLAVGHKIG